MTVAASIQVKAPGNPGCSDSSPNAAPLILTLNLDPQHQAKFDRLRDAHFPPQRNFLAAHITLFHHLPAASADAVRATLAAAAASSSPFPVAVTGVRSLGRGVAYSLQSATLSRMRSLMARQWSDVLSAQDRQGFRPHITIQNKTDPVAAHALLVQLAAEFEPFEIEATGLLLWRYRGGPWDPDGAFPFTAPERTIARENVVETVGRSSLAVDIGVRHSTSEGASCAAGKPNVTTIR